MEDIHILWPVKIKKLLIFKFYFSVELIAWMSFAGFEPATYGLQNQSANQRTTGLLLTVTVIQYSVTAGNVNDNNFMIYICWSHLIN